MQVRLSHPLSENTPFYEGLRPPSLEQLYGLERGDTCNSFYLTTSNHAGTHVDAPNHFNLRGRKITEYSPDELVFEKPAMVPFEVPNDRLIFPEHLRRIEDARPDCDILLLRSGFSARYRDRDRKEYVDRGPGFSRAAAEYIMDTLLQLRAIAMDIISASSLLHDAEGAEAHRVFLGCEGYGPRSVLLIEDAHIPDDLDVPKRILLAPWMMEGLDSAPCTVLAEI
jgi:kynurenine formamidase